MGSCLDHIFILFTTIENMIKKTINLYVFCKLNDCTWQYKHNW